MQTLAAVARAPHQDFSLETIEVTAPADGEIRVRIAGVGLCHTDLIFRDLFIPYPQPAVLGHEGAGIVEAVGPNVTGFSVGDAVVLGFSSCGHCGQCAGGVPSYCKDFVPLNYAGARSDGSTAYAKGGEAIASHFFGQSSFAGVAIVRASNAVKVPETSLPLAYLGPLGCGLQTGAGAVLRSMDCQPGSTIGIWGAGPVGLAAVMAAKIRNCARIIVMEMFEERRALALELGATDVIDPKAGNVAEQIRGLLGDGLNFAFDTTGHPGALQDAFNSLASRGLLGIVGVPKSAEETFNANLAQQITFGLRTMGIIEGDSDPVTFIPELIAYHRKGQFPFDRLVKTYPLSQINTAIADQAAGKCVKAVLIPDHA